MAKRKIAIFCGSMMGPNGTHADLAKKVVTFLVNENYGIVYGGGENGIMGVVANTALSLGGHVTGIIPNFLDNREKIHKKLDKIIITKTMEERKKKFLSLSDAFIALPGGGGTIEEISLVVSANQLGVIENKPMIIYNHNRYWDNLVRQYKQIPKQKYSNKDMLGFLPICKNLKELNTILSNKF